MKILHVINSLQVGGAEKLLVDSLPALIQQQVNVSLLVLGNNNNQHLLDICKLKNLPVICLSKTNIYSPTLILDLRRIIIDFDLIHVHLFPAQYWVALANASLPKRKRPILVTTEHSVSNRRRDKLLFRYPDRYVYAQYKSIICVSSGAYDSLAKYLSNSNRLLTIENGIDINRYLNAKPESRENFKLSYDDVIITMVAGFRHEKDQDTLIKSMKYLPDKFKLLLVGEGVRLSDCRQLCNDLNLEDRVCFAGLRHNVPEIFKMSDICVMSSHWEGLCLVAVEAMASGKVVVASNVNGLLEIVEGHGLLFERGDAKSLSDILIHLDRDKKFAGDIASKCILRSKDYSQEAFLKNTMSLYLSLLSKSKYER